MRFSPREVIVQTGATATAEVRTGTTASTVTADDARRKPRPTALAPLADWHLLGTLGRGLRPAVVVCPLHQNREQLVSVWRTSRICYKTSVAKSFENPRPENDPETLVTADDRPAAHDLLPPDVSVEGFRATMFGVSRRVSMIQVPAFSTEGGRFATRFVPVRPEIPRPSVVPMGIGWTVQPGQRCLTTRGKRADSAVFGGRSPSRPVTGDTSRLH